MEEKELAEMHDGGCACCHSAEEDYGHCHSHHHDEGDACCCATHTYKHEHSHNHEHTHHGCACYHPEEHEHDHEHGSKKDLILAAVSAALLLLGIVLHGQIAALPILLIAYFLVGFDILREAAYNICHGRIFDENFLMVVASIGAICIGETPEAVLVMLLYRIGEYLQGRAVAQSRRSIRALMDVRPDHANLVDGDKIHMVQAETVSIGSVILIKPGERIPLDGEILEGESQLDTSALTGESMPRECAPGDEILAGCINLSGALRVKVTKSFGDSAASRILQLVEHASKNKAVSEKFISRFAKIYTPVVCILAAVVAVIPGIAGWYPWSTSIYHALCFLVISCPCALVISVPLTFFAGVGAASRNGVLVKGGNYLDALAKAEMIAYDKTGTLTKGKFSVDEILPEDGVTADEVLYWGAVGEYHSTHPVAAAIRQAYGAEIEKPNDFREFSGKGVSAQREGQQILVGKAEFLRQNGVAVSDVQHVGTIVYVALDGRYLGAITLSDTLKSDTAAAVSSLRQMGIRQQYMLTGDTRDIGEKVAAQLSLDGVYSQLLPEEKLQHVEELKKKLSSKGRLIYVGDGINDTPVLAAADVGIAMGGLGADAAIEAADVVIMGDELSKVAVGIKLARNTVKIANQNIVFSILIKTLIMVLAATGHVELWLAVFADVGVCMLTILNALRLNVRR